MTQNKEAHMQRYTNDFNSKRPHSVPGHQAVASHTQNVRQLCACVRARELQYACVCIIFLLKADVSLGCCMLNNVWWCDVIKWYLLLLFTFWQHVLILSLVHIWLLMLVCVWTNLTSNYFLWCYNLYCGKLMWSHFSILSDSVTTYY